MANRELIRETKAEAPSTATVAKVHMIQIKDEIFDSKRPSLRADGTIKLPRANSTLREDLKVMTFESHRLDSQPNVNRQQSVHEANRTIKDVDTLRLDTHPVFESNFNHEMRPPQTAPQQFTV